MRFTYVFDLSIFHTYIAIEPAVTCAVDYPPIQYENIILGFAIVKADKQDE